MALSLVFLLAMVLGLLTLSAIMVTYAALRLRHAVSKLAPEERTIDVTPPPIRANLAPHPLLRR